MSPRPLQELLENILKRYKKATRQKKSVILDEFCANHKCHRKSAIRLFNKFKKLACGQDFQPVPWGTLYTFLYSKKILVL